MPCCARASYLAICVLSAFTGMIEVLLEVIAVIFRPSNSAGPRFAMRFPESPVDDYLVAVRQYIRDAFVLCRPISTRGRSRCIARTSANPKEALS